MIIYGIGIDIVEKNKIKELIRRRNLQSFLGKWFSVEEREYLMSSNNLIDDISIIFSIKESLIKASSGNVNLKDFGKINVGIYTNSFSICLSDNDFLKSKSYFITAEKSKDFIFSSILIYIE